MTVYDEEQMLSVLEENLILQHLAALESECIRYVPEFNNNQLDLMQHPLILSVERVSNSFQKEHLDLKIDFCARDLFDKKSIAEF